MAVKKAMTDLKLQIRVEDGTTAAGAAKIKSLSFSNIKLDATDQALLDAGKAIVGITNYPLSGIRCVQTHDMVDEA
ncbi:DUF1659 domain-containing protein [uncultured Dialister sp.]|uniref:DUF1659 domain-containing protein n=2 Tax=uncultured Dialister sp. TaxID=278064 RepID=UPI0026306110|nr:DUF1659 domain-containing protein [uncultured Dialister sp.]